MLTTKQNCLPARYYLVFILILFISCGKDASSSDLIGNWKRQSEYEGVSRTEAVTFTIGNKTYIGSGFDGNIRLNDFRSFDQNTSTWTKIADFPGVARNSAVAFSLNGKAYFGTGYDNNDNKLKDFWEYDPATNIWTKKADFGGSPRYGAIAFSINGKGYIGTGYDGNYLKDLWEYDPLTNTWVQKASLGGSKRSDAVVFVHNNLGYIVTGINNGTYINDFWVYNPVDNSWVEKRKISNVSDQSYDNDYGDYIKRSNSMIFLVGNKAYLTCGNRNGIIGSTWEYDLATDLWKQKTVFEGSAREGGIGFNLNGRGYLSTGNNSSYRFDDLWEFQPDVTRNDYDN